MVLFVCVQECVRTSATSVTRRSHSAARWNHTVARYTAATCSTRTNSAATKSTSARSADTRPGVPSCTTRISNSSIRPVRRCFEHTTSATSSSPLHHRRRRWTSRRPWRAGPPPAQRHYYRPISHLPPSPASSYDRVQRTIVARGRSKISKGGSYSMPKSPAAGNSAKLQIVAELAIFGQNHISPNFIPKEIRMNNHFIAQIAPTCQADAVTQCVSLNKMRNCIIFVHYVRTQLGLNPSGCESLHCITSALYALHSVRAVVLHVVVRLNSVSS